MSDITIKKILATFLPNYNKDIPCGISFARRDENSVYVGIANAQFVVQNVKMAEDVPAFTTLVNDVMWKGKVLFIHYGSSCSTARIDFYNGVVTHSVPTDSIGKFDELDSDKINAVPEGAIAYLLDSNFLNFVSVDYTRNSLQRVEHCPGYGWVSTNGHTLCIAETSNEGRTSIDSETLEFLSKAFKNGTECFVKPDAETGWFNVVVPGKCWIRSQCSSSFPDIKTVLPTKYDFHFEMETPSLLKALKDVVKHVGAKKLCSRPLRLHFSEDEIRFSYAEDVVNWSYTQKVLSSTFNTSIEHIEVGVNINYLISCLEFCNQKTVTIKLQDDLSPINITSNQGQQTILMPMRIN